MKIFIPIILLSFFIACEDPCWEPWCYDATDFRFNLLDSLGNDLFFSDSAKYSFEQLLIKDSLNNLHSIESADYGSMKFLVSLSGDYKTYQIILQDSTIDVFTVTYELLQEECCGLTPWVRDVEFKQLRTDISEDRIGSTNIYLE